MHVFVPKAPPEAVVARLERVVGDGTLTVEGSPPDETTVIVDGRPSAETLDALRNLEAVIVPFAGIPVETLEAVRARRGLALYNLHHNAAATAEKAIELLMAVAKGTLRNDARLRQNDWGGRYETPTGVSIAGKEALVLGYGRIGTRVAAALVAMGATVRATKRVARRAFDGEVEIYSPTALPNLLPKSQIIVVATPLTDETTGLLGLREIRMLPSDAILVNVARGKVVDEEALYHALRNKEILGAGLDVWWQYGRAGAERTPPSQFDFAALDNVVMSPHCGGSTVDTEELRWQALVDLIERIQVGKADAVDLDAGY